MSAYHKIPAIFKRGSEKPHPVLEGEYSTPELEMLKDVPWVFTEKIDGTNIRIMWDGHKVTFGGRTNKAQLPVNLFEKLTELFGGDAGEQLFEDVFMRDNEEDDVEVILYGEGYGASIQAGGGKYKSDGVDFILFDVRIGRWWLTRENVVEIAEHLGIKTVPVIAEGTLEEGLELVKKGVKSTFGDFLVEGLVGRPSLELSDRAGKRVITKIITKDFYKQADDK